MLIRFFLGWDELFPYRALPPSPYHTPYVHTLSCIIPAFLFLLSYPARSSRDQPHPATFGLSHLLLSKSLSTRFQPRAWMTADRRRGAADCWASITVTRTSLGDCASVPTPQPTKMEWISASSCRLWVQGRRKIKIAELHMLCPDDIWIPVSVLPAQLRIYKYQKYKASTWVER